MIYKAIILLGTPVAIAWVIEPLWQAAGLINLYPLAAIVGVGGLLLEYPPHKIKRSYFDTE